MTGQFTPSGNLDGKKEQASTMGITPFGEQGSQSVDGDGVTSLLSSQLLMVLAVLLSSTQVALWKKECCHIHGGSWLQKDWLMLAL